MISAQKRLRELVFGHLDASTPARRKDLKQLQSLLSRAQIPEDVAALKGSSFSFESSDFLAGATITDENAALLRTLETERAPEDLQYRVFVREVPVRSTQLHASSPPWAAGALAEHSLGPFANADGRLLWFDFFRVEKLVALYVQGHAYPALLFKITRGFQFIDATLPLAADPLPSYRLNAGSIWINTLLLAPDAPPGTFTGLTIRSGTVSLGARPQVIGGKLTAAPNSQVTVKLQLKQKQVTDADAASPYGGDARNMTLDLPQTLAFHFTGLSSAFDEVGDADWSLYGQEISFSWNAQQAANYDGFLHRVLIPFKASARNFQVQANESPFHTLAGKAAIAGSYWALSAAPIDVANPSPADGTGAMLVRTKPGLTARWSGLAGGALNLGQPYIMAEPGRIALTDLAAGNVVAHHDFDLWRDQQNPYGVKARLQIPAAAPYFYNTLANGTELVMTFGNADVQADRPVAVDGKPLELRSKNSLLLLAVSKAFRLIYLFDDNLLADSIDLTKTPPVFPKPIALALTNALFKVTPANGCLLFGQLGEDFVKVERGILFFTLGLLAYLPTLPDPYAANIGQLKFQFRGGLKTYTTGAFTGGQAVWQWLVGQVKWEPDAGDDDKVEVSFHFAPLQSTLLEAVIPPPETAQPDLDLGDTGDAGTSPKAYKVEEPSDVFEPPKPLPDYGQVWEDATRLITDDYFALLDVSTNADLLGISFSTFLNTRVGMFKTHVPATSAEFPLQVKKMDVVSPGLNVRAFTVPQISWEPALNFTRPKVLGDPAEGVNYYPDDGGPTRILNNSGETVALAPLPLTDFLVENFAGDDKFAAVALSTLPFGMRMLALLQKGYVYQGQTRPGATFGINAKKFPDNLTGARQLQADGGDALRRNESKMFMGSTLQVNNVLDLYGNGTGNSTLGRSVTEIFNNEWMLDPFQLVRQRGVPLERVDWSGYGSSIFSNWLNPNAAIAETSQAKFDVWVGRCAHEIIQVRSIVYPWAIKVVRTITLFRTLTGYVYRYDTGWRAESDGRFDFRYFIYEPNPDPAHPGTLIPKERQAPYQIHPGVVGGLFLVKDIEETKDIEPVTGTMTVHGKYVDINGREVDAGINGTSFPFELQPIYFNADIEIENPVSGFAEKELAVGVKRKLVPARQILGFVQIAPRGMPLTEEAFKQLIDRQAGSIGAPIDCVVDIAKSGQQMRLVRFDISNSFQQDGSKPAFAVAGRGNVLLPKDGAWSLVRHEFGTGAVSPVPKELSVPLIRIGKLVSKPVDIWGPDIAPQDALLRIANPADLLRPAAADTLNYGFLQSTDTQKALFLTPSFKVGIEKMLSKSPPLFADAFRIVNSKAIFPNVGKAIPGNIGDAISLLENAGQFKKAAGILDGATDVFELMQINETAAGVKKEGYKLLKQLAEPFKLPNKEWTLIDLGGAFKIYLEYKADKIQTPGGEKNAVGGLDFDINSFTNTVADQWKSKMANVGVVIDLGPIKRLMTIKGNWDAKKGAEAQYAGNAADPDFPSPQIEFADELEPVIEILQILQDLQGENYKDAFSRGLKLAMSNKAGSWEYKMEASKEIPVVRFPMPMFMYNDPNAPLKLEAGLKLGAYFNAALKVTTDPNQLLPTAGAFLGFYGKLSVMCVSISIATVYAVGQVNLDIAADTKTGPSLRMKFGFGAQIVVGLPVVGNVSVLYMVTVEIYTNATDVVVSAGLLFQGHAELLAGLVSVTITIEAKGTVAKLGDRTDLAAQVTFGLDISIFLVINISFSTSWEEQRQIA
ncbi:hypothetical protein G5V57_06130 [Nordella sp. HKS 07]|uniref:hypothetical protein n=1 Tax=Nordella sp. HKS 07 TaxID=2712222 RepID=UPI0013E15549|nr:hypothetical protein [Nordella sp. HKS 07]QIG47350.1 hypothetical protein G5V57_06130 [Nordella sp. HKS 07]